MLSFALSQLSLDCLLYCDKSSPPINKYLQRGVIYYVLQTYIFLAMLDVRSSD